MLYFNRSFVSFAIYLHIFLLAYLVAVYFPWETLITYLMTHYSDFMRNICSLTLYHKKTPEVLSI